MNELLMLIVLFLGVGYIFMMWRSGALKLSDFERASGTMAILAIVLMLFVSILVFSLQGGSS